MQNMAQEMTVQSGYVLVERPDDFEVVLEEQSEMLAELARLCACADCRKVLIRGHDTKVDLAPLDIYELGKQIAKHHLQIAVVESHNASSDDVNFLKTVAQNRGGPISFFDDEESAKLWLQVQ